LLHSHPSRIIKQLYLHMSLHVCVCSQPATRRGLFLYMLVVDLFGIRNSSMKEGRMCWFLGASTQDGPVAAKAHAHTPGSWWWCSWEEHDACCQLQKLQETSCPSPSMTWRTGTTTNIDTHPPIRRTLYSEESATAASGLVGPKSRERRERERERMAGARTTTHILGDWRIREETLGWSTRIWCCEDGHNTITTLFLLLLSMSMSSSSSSLLTTELGVAKRIPELRVHHSLLLTQHQKRSRQHFPAPLESSLFTASLLLTAAFPRSLPAPPQQTSMS